MTGKTRAELERRLVRHLQEEVERVMETVDVQRQQELLETKLRKTHRRPRPVYLVTIAAAAAAAAVIVAVLALTARTGSHKAAPTTTPSLPQPAAQILTVYSGHGPTPGSVDRVTWFIDTRGRWCVADVDSSSPPSASNYDCRSAMLPASGHGFGAVYGIGDSPTYDNFNSWFGGVATPDVARVTVVFGDRTVHSAQVLSQGTRGVLFNFEWPTTWSNPAYYRAYAADGHLIQQIPVKQAVIPTG